MHASHVATGAPVWVYFLLAGLVLLGVRRLKTREMPLVLALLPSIAFLIWSILGAAAFAAHAGVVLAAGAWLGGAALGAISGVLLPEPRGVRLTDGRVRQPGSWLPLIQYLTVFVIRFACGAWAAMVPAEANLATAIGIGFSAVVTARLVLSTAKWLTAPPSAAAA